MSSAHKKRILDLGLRPMTAEGLRAYCSYDPDTGQFKSKFDQPHAPAGTILGHVSNRGYVTMKIGGLNYQAHRLAWLHFHGVWPSVFIDHKDHDKTNNTIGNLREANRHQNEGNRLRCRRNRTGFKGVYRGRDKFIAQIRENGRRVHLGSFETPELARDAYVDAHKRIWGDFHHPGQ